MLRALRLGPRGPAVALLCACALTVSNAVVRAAPTKPVDGAVLEDGEQKVTYADGTVYEGEWRDGGPIHRGASRRGVPEGHGKLTFPNGDVYKGDFKNDKREGNGKVTYANGDVYEGKFATDKREGQGTYTGADGEVYEGEFKAGKRDGRGTWTSADGKEEY